MKKSLFILLFVFLKTTAFAKLNVIVSIQPQVEFLQKIGGEMVDITLMVPIGKSPHTYEPKATQMRAITKADLYLAIGVEFEKIWLDRFLNQNHHLIIKDLSKDINKSNTISNPHIWVDPIMVKKIAQNIYHALISVDKAHQDYYQENLNNYLKELDLLDHQIKEILKSTPKGTAFMVFHPAWDYFAKRYHLQQLAIEIEGKSPKPRELISIIKRAKKEHIKAIFTQPEFSDQMAQTIAKTLHIKVIKTSPLSKDWAENLKNLADAIAQGKK
jgi:zinc transport system substrate-binding protein